MFARTTAPPMRLSLGDLEVVVAIWQQRAAAGDETTGRIAIALDTVLQTRRARSGVRERPAALPAAPTASCPHGLQGLMRRCWAGMNAPLRVPSVRRAHPRIHAQPTGWSV